MNLTEAIAAIRGLTDLSEPRRAHLVRELTTAPTTGRWSVIVAEARQEALHARLTTREAITDAYAEQREREALRAAQKPERKVAGTVTPEGVQRAVQMRAEGHGVPEIASVLDLSTTTVYKMLNRAPEPLPVIPAKVLKPWKPEPLAPDDPRHGKASSYRNRGCRCQKCRDAHREDKARRRAEGPSGAYAVKAEHGTRSRYARGCRCDDCRAAATAAARADREKKK